MKRLRESAKLLGMAAIGAVGGVITIGGGYWLSDLLYGWGLWPLGALLRLALLPAVVGFVLFLGATLLSASAALIQPEADPASEVPAP